MVCDVKKTAAAQQGSKSVSAGAAAQGGRIDRVQQGKTGIHGQMTGNKNPTGCGQVGNIVGHGMGECGGQKAAQSAGELARANPFEHGLSGSRWRQ